MNTPPVAATVDLQVHSTASDGAAEPAAVAVAAARARLTAFALTDHDSTAGVEAATAAAAPFGIRVVPGVELSTRHGNDELHILGLHLESLPLIEGPLAGFRAERSERAEAIVGKLSALGLEITFEDVAREARLGAIGRPHVARALIARGHVRDFREAFDRYLGAGRPAFVAKPVLTVRDGIALIHGAGGIAVWAHPGGMGRLAMLEPLVAEGLDGVEVRHPGHSSEDAARLLALCEHLRIVPSGGSDWHGETIGGRVLGVMQVPAEWLARQDERVAVRRGAGVS